MSTIIFTRPEENFNTRHSYEIYASGRRIAELKNGETKQLEVDADFFEAKTLWCGSGKISVGKAAGNQAFEVRGNRFLNQKMGYIGAMVPLIGLGVAQFEVLENITLAVLSLVMVGIIASITIAKNKWIEVRPLT